MRKDVVVNWRKLRLFGLFGISREDIPFKSPPSALLHQSQKSFTAFLSLSNSGRKIKTETFALILNDEPRRVEKISRMAESNIIKII